LIILTAIAWPISLANTYTFLSYFSVAGIIVGMLSLAFTMVLSVDYMNENPELDQKLPAINVAQTFGYIGASLWIFEGNAVVLNVRAEAINKQNV